MEHAENPAELRALLEMHHAAAWRWALFCACGDRSRGEDVLHDVYLKVLNGKARFSGRSSFRTWLFGVIRWTAIAVRRRNALISIMLERIGENTAHVATDPSAPGEPFSPALMTALAELSTQQRQVALLVFEHDLTLEEAAQVMKLTVGTTRQHYARAKEKLRLALAKGASDE